MTVTLKKDSNMKIAYEFRYIFAKSRRRKDQSFTSGHLTEVEARERAEKLMERFGPDGKVVLAISPWNKEKDLLLSNGTRKAILEGGEWK